MASAGVLNSSLPSLAWRWPWPLVLAVMLVIAGGVAWDRWSNDGSASLDPATIQPWFGARNFAEATAQTDRQVVGKRESLAHAPGEWVLGEDLALAIIARWRLLGNYDDLAEADHLLNAGMTDTSGPAGPVLAEATLAVLVHRLDQAETALARFAGSVAPDAADQADAAALAGDVALQRGDLDSAGQHYAKAAGIAETSGIAVRRSVLDFSRGYRGKGIRALEALLARPRQPPSLLAALALQRANFAYAEGDWDGAGRWIGAAQRVFPGYWLADAYAAQQFALAGRSGDAIRAYEIVARRTNRPEVQDALAHLLRLEGQGAESRAWAAQAAASWEARAQLFPEAVVHHQAEHEIAVGSAGRALAYAQTDIAQRPQAPNLVLLARALLSAGRAREALAALDRADAQGWVSAGQQMARAEVLAALGRTADSEQARARAEAINPRAADPRTRLIWFGHD